MSEPNKCTHLAPLFSCSFHSSGYQSGTSDSGEVDGFRDSCTTSDESKLLVRRNYRFLVHEIYTLHIVDKLYEKSLIDERTLQELSLRKTQYGKNDIIIKSVLRKSGEDKLACRTFLEILEEASWPGLILKLKDLADRRRSSVCFHHCHISKDTICAALISCKNIIIEESNPLDIADFLFENEDLGSAEHDKIIKCESRALQAETLFVTVMDKQCIRQFMYALESTEHRMLLKELNAKLDNGTSQRQTITDSVVEVMDVDETVAPANLKQCITDLDGDIVMTLTVSANQQQEENISEQMVQVCTTSNGDSSIMEVCTGTLHHLIEDVQHGCVIIQLSPIVSGSFQKFLEKNNLREFVKLLFSHPNVKKHLPIGEFLLRVKCVPKAVQKTMKTQFEEGKTFRLLTPYIIERYHPKWLLERLLSIEGIPTQFLSEIHIPEEVESRRKSTLYLMRQIYNCGSVSLKFVNQSLRELLGEEDSKRILGACPFCMKQKILQNYTSLSCKIVALY